MIGIQRLLELIREVSSEPDLDRLLQRVLAAAIEVSRAERGFVVLANGSVHVRAARNLTGAEIREAESKISRTILDRALAADRPLVLRDGELTARSVRSQRVRAVCALPLRTPRGALGAVYLDHRFDRNVFSADQLDLLAAIGQQAAVAIERARPAETHVPRTGSAILGRSPAIRRVLELVERFAPLPYPVLIQGESGTGKELVARALHARSGRPRFVAANVAALPDALFESEMFGHVRGAFTGAESDRPGLFEQADGGTLLLDEINSLGPGLQEKLLRVLQEREVRRVGGSRAVPVDVRLVAATNGELGPPFRQDLFHRLNVLRIELPPLRARREDIPVLAGHFLEGISGELGRTRRLSPRAAEKLQGHDWPGNVRELENALRRAAALSDAELLEAEDFVFRTESPSQVVSLDEYVRARLSAGRSGMTLQELATQLGVSRKTLWAMRRRFGLA